MPGAALRWLLNEGALPPSPFRRFPRSLLSQVKMQITDETELSAAVRGANGPLRVVGGGTRILGAEAGETLDLSGLSGISLYEPGALTMVAGAGTPVAEISKTLAAQGQRLAFEPYFLRDGVSTIGGVMATNASGPRRIQVGAARDFLLGVRFVDGSGRVVQNGGRVMKNVTGYDLVKLMAGSRGILGVLSEVSFKVLPLPETEATVIVHGLDGVGAVAAMARALGSPFDVSGAAYGPVRSENAPTLFRVEGFEGSVTYRVAQLRALLARFGEIEVQDDGDASAALWADVRDAVAFGDCAYLARVSIKPSDFSGLHDLLRGHEAEVALDWGGGLVWVGSDGPDAVGLHIALQGFCAENGGHTTIMRAPGAVLSRVPALQPEPAGLAALTAGLRAQFDPRGLFSQATAGTAQG